MGFHPKLTHLGYGLVILNVAFLIFDSFSFNLLLKAVVKQLVLMLKALPSPTLVPAVSRLLEHGYGNVYVSTRMSLYKYLTAS